MFPIIGHLPVDAIDTVLVMKVVEPLWHTAIATASRVPGRIENVLDWAAVSELRIGDNPARWKGHLEHKLAKKSKVAPVKHYSALPYQEIAGFVSQLRAYDDQDMRALELAILCASRSAEVMEARWDEIKFAEKLWVIPEERMKTMKEHRIPPSDAAIAILKRQHAIQSNDYVFPTGRGNGHVGKNTLLRVLERLGRRDLTVHGFRSTSRDWCGEVTSFTREVAEMALAHTVGNAVEAAYRRGDLFQKRRDLVEAWASYCAGGEVITFPVGVRSA